MIRRSAAPPLSEQKPVKGYVREAEDQLKFLIEKQFTAEELRFRKDFHDKFRGKNSRVPIRTHNKYNYVKGVLDLIYGYRTKLNNEPIAVQHLEFLYILGLSPEQIVYCMFTMGYINTTIDQVRRHFAKVSIKVKLRKLQNEYMGEINILKQKVFQELGGQVMEQEKEYLETLLKQLPELQRELKTTDVVHEPTKWNRLNKQIQEILAQCKGMHGIDEKRSAVVKTAAAMTLHNMTGKGNSDLPTLPEPIEHEEMRDARIITLKTEDHVVRTDEEL